MDFIEQLFGLSPDNGDGSTEILWLVVLAVVIAAFVYFRIQRRRARSLASRGSIFRPFFPTRCWTTAMRAGRAES